MPYRIAGKMIVEGSPQIVLAKGNAVVAVREGDSLDDGYRVESIKPDYVTLIYVPLGVRENLPVTWSFITDGPFAEPDAPPAE
jgi:hypothetical protein